LLEKATVTLAFEKFYQVAEMLEDRDGIAVRTDADDYGHQVCV